MQVVFPQCACLFRRHLTHTVKATVLLSTAISTGALSAILSSVFARVSVLLPQEPVALLSGGHQHPITALCISDHTARPLLASASRYLSPQQPPSLKACRLTFDAHDVVVDLALLTVMQCVCGDYGPIPWTSMVVYCNVCLCSPLPMNCHPRMQSMPVQE